MIIKLNDGKKTMASSECVYELFQGYFKTLDVTDRDKEFFFVLHLDVRNRIKLMDLVSVGIERNLYFSEQPMSKAMPKAILG